MANPFTYFELHTSDLAASKAFYGRLFDWKITDAQTPGLPYAEVNPGEGPTGGLRGRVDEAPSSMWMPYFQVGDIDASISKAKELGAKALVPRSDIPVGSYAVFADPLGVTFALFQPARR